MAAARRVPRRHRDAVAKLLRSTGLGRMPDEAPLVELLKDLAAEMDAGGGTRTRADYLSALKDARRVLNDSAKPEPTTSRRKAPAKVVAEVIEDVKPTAEDDDDLTAFRKKRGIPA